jgi:lipid II:glycine glycyltransferase (peptidoglycan interpeptide bridge formation enzyme)
LQGGGPLYKVGANKQAVCAALSDWLGRASFSARIVGSRIVTTDAETGRLLMDGDAPVPSKRGIMNVNLDTTPPETIWNTLFSGTGQQRTDIRKLERLGLELKFSSDSQALVDFEVLHQATLKRLGAHPKPHSFYKELWDALHPKYLRFGLVSMSGETLCALANLEFAPSRTIHLFLLGYRRDTLGSLSLPLFALWKTVEWAWKNGFCSMDLGGTSADSSDRHYQFKAQFGAKLVSWYEIRLIPHPAIYSGVRRITKLIGT